MDRAERLIDYGVRQCEAFRDESLQRGRASIVATVRESIDAGSDAIELRLQRAFGVSLLSVLGWAMLLAALALMVRIHFVITLR